MAKRYEEILKLVDKTKEYDIKEAIELVKKTSSAKFDETIEVSIRLNLNKEGVRGAVVLPNGTGKDVTLLVLAKGDQAKAAKDAGADFVGDTDLIEKISKENWFDFDTIIATPEMMVELGKIGKLLGPKGLMPNPKTGTVTTDTKKAVEDVKKGKAVYKNDANGNLHLAFGKASFTVKKLTDNFNALMAAVMKSKPSDIKGELIKKITVSSTMGPGIKVSKKEIDK